MTDEPMAAVAEPRTVLEAFERAIGREAHNLVRWPELTWQQLYNRLQWEEGPVPAALAPERGRRSAPGAVPWMRTRHPFRESRALLRTLEGHTEGVSGCAVSPDGAFVVSGSRDGTLRIWDPATGAELRNLGGHRGPVHACAVSPDGSFVASASTRPIELPSTPMGMAEFPPDYLIRDPRERSRLRGASLTLWDPATGKVLRTLEGHDDVIEACAWSPDGSFIVSASSDRTLKLWDPASGEELRTLEGHTEGVSACAVSPDGAFVVSGSRDKTLRMWDPASGEELHALEGHTEGVSACAVSPDGAFVVSASYRTLKIWDPATGEELRTLQGHIDGISACAVSPDGASVVSGSLDGTLKLWDPGKGRELRTLEGHGGPVGACAWSPEGAFVVSGSSDRTLKLWDPATGEELSTLEGHNEGVSACAVSPDGSFIVSASGDGTLRLWNPDGEELYRLEVRDPNAFWPLSGHHAVEDCAISPLGSFVVSASRGTELPRFFFETYQDRILDRLGALRLWDTSTGRDFRTRYHEGVCGYHKGVSCCAVSPDDSFIVSGSLDGTLKLWDPEKGRELRTLEGSGTGVLSCAVSPDGTFVVSANAAGGLTLRDPATGQLLHALQGHRGAVHDCAVSPDGSFVVSVGGDKTLRVWDAATGGDLATLPLPAAPMCVALHPRFPLAFCGDATGNLNLLDLIGIEFGPIVVTAADRGDGSRVRCPSCLKDLPVETGWLGALVDCPQPDCEGRVRVNPFVARLRQSEEPAVDHWYEVADAGDRGRDLLLECRLCGHSMTFNPGLGEQRPRRCPACNVRGSLD